MCVLVGVSTNIFNVSVSHGEVLAFSVTFHDLFSVQDFQEELDDTIIISWWSINGRASKYFNL